MNQLSSRRWLDFLTRAAVLAALVAGSVAPGIAGAAETAAKGGEPARRFASVWRLRGEISAVGESGTERKLREGDPLFVGERVRAAATAEAVLKTDDAGLIAIRPGAEFLAERFAAEGKPTDGFSLRLVTGALRVISGWIGRTNRAEHRIITPAATIGIRGTDHEPYVMSAELAATLAQKEGTYDKVNRGGTTLDVGGQTLDIEPGKVGFVRAPKPFKTRALMTILLPVLLDKVPDFYVPGQFDAELDRLSPTADENALRQLEERRQVPVEASASEAAAVSASTATPPTLAPRTSAVISAADECAADSVARTWLKQLDAAIARREAPAIVRLFAPEVVVRATVRGSSGESTSVEIGRDELAQSTIVALKGLRDYQQRRPSIEGRPAETGGAASCDRIAVRSVVIEQGRRGGKPYRFESVEEYRLEKRSGKWLAVTAETTQR